MASIKRSPLLAIRNHLETGNVLRHLAGKASLSWYEDEVVGNTRNWFRLGSQHLQMAVRLASAPKQWRAAVSRCYYGAYNFSKSVRYLVGGAVKADATDHQEVGDLPPDFPNVASWQSFLVSLRKDRNIADYEPWPQARRALSDKPVNLVARAQQFSKEVRRYLTTKGAMT